MARRRAPEVAEALFLLAALTFAALMFGVGVVVGHSTRDEGEAAGEPTAVATEPTGTATAPLEETTPTQPAETGETDTGGGGTGAGDTGTGGGDDGGGEDGGGGAQTAAAGERIFAEYGCGNCHTLAAAGSNGNVGPNLDESEPSLDKAIDRVTNGKGAMPAFKGQLSDAQIRAVAQYVSSAAGD